MTIEKLMADMQAILDEAEGRSLTDEEVERYEGLERELTADKKTAEIRARQSAYRTPVEGAVRTVETADAKDQDELTRAFEHYMRTGKVNGDLIEVRAQEAGDNSEGGFLVPSLFRQKLVEVREKIGGLAAVVENITTETGAPMEYPSIDDTSNDGEIVDEEGTPASGADLAFGSVVLGAFTYTTAGAGNDPLRVSVELAQDSQFDIQGLAFRKLGRRIFRSQAKDWTLGTGSSQPTGIADVTTATEDVQLGTDNPLTYAKALELEDALDVEYQDGAVHVMNQKTWSAWRAVEDSNGRPLILPQAQSGIGGRAPRELIGYPVIIDNTMPDIADNVIFQVFGNMAEAYVIRRVGGGGMIVNPFSRMNNRQIEYTMWERADGNIQNRAAYVTLSGEDA